MCNRPFIEENSALYRGQPHPRRGTENIMALIATAAGGKDFIPVPPGNHVGRCYQIIGLGTQKSEFQGKVRFAKKVMLAFELFGEDEDGQALVVEDGWPMTVRL